MTLPTLEQGRADFDSDLLAKPVQPAVESIVLQALRGA